MGQENWTVVVVREFETNKDRGRVEAVEKICEVGPSGKLSLLTDLMGDPICRVRHSPSFLMLVYYIHSFILFFPFSSFHFGLFYPSSSSRTSLLINDYLNNHEVSYVRL